MQKLRAVNKVRYKYLMLGKTIFGSKIKLLEYLNNWINTEINYFR